MIVTLSFSFLALAGGSLATGYETDDVEMQRIDKGSGIVRDFVVGFIADDR